MFYILKSIQYLNPNWHIEGGGGGGVTKPWALILYILNKRKLMKKSLKIVNMKLHCFTQEYINLVYLLLFRMYEIQKQKSFWKHIHLLIIGHSVHFKGYQVLFLYILKYWKRHLNKTSVITKNSLWHLAKYHN